MCRSPIGTQNPAALTNVEENNALFARIQPVPAAPQSHGRTEIFEMESPFSLSHSDSDSAPFIMSLFRSSY